MGNPLLVRLTLGNDAAGAPAVKFFIYFMSYDGMFYAVEADRGKLRWKFTTGGERRFEAKNLHGMLPRNQTIADPYDVFLSSPVVAEGTVFFGFQSSPAVVSGVVYVGCRDSNLYAIDAASGTEKWRVNNQGSWVIGSPAVTQGKVVYATSDSALFHEVDAATGKPLLKQDVKAYTFASPTVAGERDRVARG